MIESLLKIRYLAPTTLILWPLIAFLLHFLLPRFDYQFEQSMYFILCFTSSLTPLFTKIKLTSKILFGISFFAVNIITIPILIIGYECNNGNCF
jgi:hypothetical protein